MPCKVVMWSIPVGCLFIMSCSAQPVFVPLSPMHPASPWVSESVIPARSGTLAVHQSEIVPPHPDWQIPGMRDDELHGHAAGQPSAMDMMGHGDMSMHGGHGGHGDAGHDMKDMPGMVKMSAPRDKVDYAPEGAVHPNGKEPIEHKPEAHLDHVDKSDRQESYKSAPVAPPMDHSKMDHSMPSMDHSQHEGHDMKDMDMGGMKMDGMDHSTMDHSMPGMDHSKHKGHDMKDMDMGGMKMDGMDMKTSPSASGMDHSHHEM